MATEELCAVQVMRLPVKEPYVEKRRRFARERARAASLQVSTMYVSIWGWVFKVGGSG